MTNKKAPSSPPKPRLDAELQLTLTPERHESIARTWSIEESNARFRRQRAETLVSETVIDIIGTEKLSAQDVRALADSTARLKKEDVALDKARVLIDVEQLKARTRLKVERIRARTRLQLQRERQQLRLARIDAIQKNWLKRELLRQKHRKDLETKRADGRQKLEDKKGRHRFRLTRLKIHAAKEAAAQRIEAAKATTPPLRGSVASCLSGSSKDPYPPGARYGRDPQTGRPYNRQEFLIHLRRAVYDVYGLNLPGEKGPDGVVRDPDTYFDRIDDEGNFIETPEEKAERQCQELRGLQRLDPTYRPFSATPKSDPQPPTPTEDGLFSPTGA